MFVSHVHCSALPRYQCTISAENSKNEERKKIKASHASQILNKSAFFILGLDFEQEFTKIVGIFLIDFGFLIFPSILQLPKINSVNFPRSMVNSKKSSGAKSLIDLKQFEQNVQNSNCGDTCYLYYLSTLSETAK